MLDSSFIWVYLLFFALAHHHMVNKYATSWLQKKGRLTLTSLFEKFWVEVFNDVNKLIFKSRMFLRKKYNIWRQCFIFSSSEFTGTFLNIFTLMIARIFDLAPIIWLTNTWHHDCKRRVGWIWPRFLKKFG
jgi:hypothetical protein